MKELFDYVILLHNMNEVDDYAPTEDEETLITNVNNNPEYAEIVKKIRETNDISEQLDMVSKFIKDQASLQSQAVKEDISKELGVAKENIETYEMQNGKSLFKFINPNTNQVQVIENLGRESVFKQIDNYNKPNITNAKYQNLDFFSTKHSVSDLYNSGRISKEYLPVINNILSTGNQDITYLNKDATVGLDNDGDLFDIAKGQVGYSFSSGVKLENVGSLLTEKIKTNPNINKYTQGIGQVFNDLNTMKNNNDKKEFKKFEKEVNKKIDNFGVDMMTNLGVNKNLAKAAIKVGTLLDHLPAGKIAKYASRKFVAKTLYTVKGTSIEKHANQALNMGKKKVLSYSMGSYGFVNLIFISVLILVVAIVIIIII